MKRQVKIFYSFLFLIVSFSLEAQNLTSSNVRFETQFNKKTIWATSGACFVQVNESSAEMAVRLDLSTLDTDNDLLDSMVANIENQFLYLKGNFPTKKLTFSDANNEDPDEFPGKGFLTINGITKSVTYSVSLINIGDDTYTIGNGIYPLRVNLAVEFEPEDFGLDKILPGLTYSIKMNIGKGYINKMNLGGQTIFSKN